MKATDLWHIRPLPNPRAVVQGKNYRFTVLTSRLLRLEYEENGAFRDTATQLAICREFPVPEFTVTDTDSLLAHHIEGWKHAQRSVFCQLDHLTYLIITSEGPDQSKGGGLTIPEIAQLACDMGAQQAFNLDGGSSAALLLEGTRVNCTKTPLPNPRQIGDIIFFVTAEP